MGDSTTSNGDPAEVLERSVAALAGAYVRGLVRDEDTAAVTRALEKTTSLLDALRQREAQLAVAIDRARKLLDDITA